jgi:hypothetical protein
MNKEDFLKLMDNISESDLKVLWVKDRGLYPSNNKKGISINEMKRDLLKSFSQSRRSREWFDLVCWFNLFEENVTITTMTKEEFKNILKDMSSEELKNLWIDDKLSSENTDDGVKLTFLELKYKKEWRMHSPSEAREDLLNSFSQSQKHREWFEMMLF